MADAVSPASIKQKLLNLARRDSRVHEVTLVRYALERFLHRLSISKYRDQLVLKGGMLVTLWLDGGFRETRDADFLGFGEADQKHVTSTIAEIMSIHADDGLEFDIAGLRATAIREEMEYGGIRLRTFAYLERTRIPVTIDIGFGDALPGEAEPMDYPSLLGMETPRIRTYPPAAVIAEKFEAIVALGLVNGRMKDFHDLWAVPKAVDISDSDLDAAIAATFKRRGTKVPAQRPAGLSADFFDDRAKRAQWRAYARSIQIADVELDEVANDIWKLLEPSCTRLAQPPAAEG